MVSSNIDMSTTPLPAETALLHDVAADLLEKSGLVERGRASQHVKDRTTKP
jgi:hypothetical protein